MLFLKKSRLPFGDLINEDLSLGDERVALAKLEVFEIG